MSSLQPRQVLTQATLGTVCNAFVPFVSFSTNFFHKHEGPDHEQPHLSLTSSIIETRFWKTQNNCHIFWFSFFFFFFFFFLVLVNIEAIFHLMPLGIAWRLIQKRYCSGQSISISPDAQSQLLPVLNSPEQQQCTLHPATCANQLVCSN